MKLRAKEKNKKHEQVHSHHGGDGQKPERRKYKWIMVCAGGTEGLSDL